MQETVFVFDGAELDFRTLDPAPVHYWGSWSAREINGVMIGSVLLDHPNRRMNTHPKMTLMPVNGEGVLSDLHATALGKVGLPTKKGDTLRVALTQLQKIAPGHLDPERF